MAELKVPSGASVVINVASWGEANALRQAIMREMAASGMQFSLEADASTLIATVLKVDSSDSVYAALWPCLARCLRDGEKITPKTFDDITARQDYYDIVISCVQENLAPLVVSLFSWLSPLINKKQASPVAQKPE